MTNCPFQNKLYFLKTLLDVFFLHIFLFNAGSDWKDHEYRSGNQDNYNSSRRGRNVQSNIRDYEVDDTRVYDYEKDDDDDEKPQEEQPQPRVSDWSLEVEEEEERLSHVVPVKSLAPGVASSEQLPQHRGGIIRLPPDAMTSTTNDSMTASGSQSGDWRAHPPPPHHPQVCGQCF